MSLLEGMSVCVCRMFGYICVCVCMSMQVMALCMFMSYECVDMYMFLCKRVCVYPCECRSV